eukprot:PhF_6_TR37936/c0_g1_i1/m.56715
MNTVDDAISFLENVQEVNLDDFCVLLTNFISICKAITTIGQTKLKDSDKNANLPLRLLSNVRDSVENLVDALPTFLRGTGVKNRTTAFPGYSTLGLNPQNNETGVSYQEIGILLKNSGTSLCRQCKEIVSYCPLHPQDMIQPNVAEIAYGYYPFIMMLSHVPLIVPTDLTQALQKCPVVVNTWLTEVEELEPCERVVYAVFDGTLQSEYAEGGIVSWEPGATVLSTIRQVMSLVQGESSHSLLEIHAKSARHVSPFTVNPNEKTYVFPTNTLFLIREIKDRSKYEYTQYRTVDEYVIFDEIVVRVWKDLLPYIPENSNVFATLLSSFASGHTISESLLSCGDTNILNALAALPGGCQALQILGTLIPAAIVKSKDNQGLSTLDAAVRSTGNEDSVLYLIRQGAVVNMSVDSKVWDRITQHSVSTRQPIPHLLLLLHTVAPTLSGPAVQTAVMNCAQWDLAVIVDFLLRLPQWTPPVRHAVITSAAVVAASRASTSVLQILWIWEAKCITNEVIETALLTAQMKCLEWIHSMGMLSSSMLGTVAKTGSTTLLEGFLSLIDIKKILVSEWHAAVLETVDNSYVDALSILLHLTSMYLDTDAILFHIFARSVTNTQINDRMSISALIVQHTSLAPHQCAQLLEEIDHQDAFGIYLISSLCPAALVHFGSNAVAPIVSFIPTPKQTISQFQRLLHITVSNDLINKVLDERNATLLHHVSRLGRMDCFKSVAECYDALALLEGLQTKDTDGNDCLCYSILGKNTEITAHLLSIPDFVINSRALLCAVHVKDCVAIVMLLDKGARIDSLVPRSVTLTTGAVSRSSLATSDSVNTLAEATFPFQDDPPVEMEQRLVGWNALHLAAWQGASEIIELLIAKGCLVDVPTSDGWTPIMLACYQGHRNIVLQLSNTSNAVQFSIECLHCAVRGDHEKIVEDILCKSPQLMSQSSSFRWTALTLASRHNCIRSLKLMLEMGANPNEYIPFNESRGTPLLLGAYYGHETVCKELVAAGADITMSSGVGHTALMAACYAGNVVIVKFLISLGVKVNAQSENGVDALHLAIMNSQSQCASLLLEHGATPTKNHVINSSDDHLTATLERKVSWVPTDEARSCASCDARFSLTRRKHHCRTCGNVFCSVCCPEVKTSMPRRCVQCAKDIQ